MSYQRTALRQLGQREPGHTIDSSAGIRWMQTLRKLPMISPAKNAIATNPPTTESPIVRAAPAAGKPVAGAELDYGLGVAVNGGCVSLSQA